MSDTIKYDDVNFPKHYTQGKFETIEEMEIAFGALATYHFCICNAWKYRARADYKGNKEQDLEKAEWYLEKAKELKEKLNEKNK